MAKTINLTLQDEWLSHLKGWKASGLTKIEYCLREGIDPPKLSNWRKVLVARGLYSETSQTRPFSNGHAPDGFEELQFGLVPPPEIEAEPGEPSFILVTAHLYRALSKLERETALAILGLLRAEIMIQFPNSHTPASPAE